jgi:hypothetical protein
VAARLHPAPSAGRLNSGVSAYLGDTKILEKRQFIAFMILMTITVLIVGCKPKTSEQRLGEFCVEQLSKQLAQWTKYSSWNTNEAKGALFDMQPDTKFNEKYKTNQFYRFEVILSDFTVKNGFNADVKSFASCKGQISKDSAGNYKPPSELLTEITVDGEKLGL